MERAVIEQRLNQLRAQQDYVKVRAGRDRAGRNTWAWPAWARNLQGTRIGSTCHGS